MVWENVPGGQVTGRAGGAGGAGDVVTVGIQRVEPTCRFWGLTPGLASTMLWTLTP